MAFMLSFFVAWFGASIVVGLVVGKFLKGAHLGGAVLWAMLLAGPAWAQEAQSGSSLASAYTFVVAGNAADLWTTQQAFSRGAVEGNGLVHGRPTRTLVVSKCVFTGAVLFAMHQLAAHGHRKAARVLGYVDGGVTFAAAGWNHTRMR